MRLSGTLSRTISTSRGLGDQLWDLAGNRPSLDLPFADNKSLVDATTGQNLVTFTRASSGTYVDSQGVIRTATTNLLPRSEEFNDAIWAKIASTVLANQIQSPIGTLTADEIIEDSSTGNHYATNGSLSSSVSGTVYTYSVYLKAGQRNFCFVVANGPGTVQSVSVNLSTGAATSAVGSPSNITSVSIGNGWYRVSFTYTSGTTGSVGHEVRLSTDGVWANRSYTGNGTGSVYAWGAQLEQSSTVGEYIPTTSTINSAPRFDHNPTTGESLGLLVEEARTNSIRNNTMVGAVAGTPGTLPTNWVTNLPANGISGAVSAIGTENGITYIDYRISGTASADIAPVLRFEANNNAAASSGQSWTASLYAKLTAGSLGSTTLVHQLRWTDSGGSVLSTVNTGAAFTPTGSALGGQRYSATGTAIASTAFVSQLLATSTIANGSTVDFTLRIGLPQLEQGAFATSVIPTSTTAVTRSADVASITGSNFSSWYRQDEGTVFADTFNRETFPGANVFPYIVQIDDGTNNNRISYDNSVLNSGYRYNVPCTSGGVSQGELNQFGFASGAARWASAFRTNDFAFAINLSPSVVSTRTSGTLPSVMTQLRIGSGFGKQFTGTIRRLTYWPQRLPNSTLQQITQ